MNYLINCYSKEAVVEKIGEFEQFSSFFSGNLAPLEDWLENCFKNKLSKSDVLSDEYRNEGNVFYKKKMYKEAICLYTKSLRFATGDSDSYGLALANRSAVLFMMEDYINCLKDIELCLTSSYPNDLKMKVLIRQVQCYSFLGKDDLMSNVIIDIKVHLQKIKDTTKKEQYKKALSKVGFSTKKPLPKLEVSDDNLPQFVSGAKNDENATFPAASSLLKLDYNDEKGRHVRAVKNIKQGDTLFVEKAFISSLIFSESKEFTSDLCYNCLKNTPHLISCQYCTRCLFCSRNCIESSWENYHQWECAGLQTDLFYECGIAFPALKAVLKGTKTNFKDSSYKNFDGLLSHYNDIKNTLPLLVVSSVIVLYLKNYTRFFVGRDENYTQYIGAKIVKHMAQMSCNASVIKHWEFDGEVLPKSATSVACGIYPSVSMMNHSCNANVSLYYVRDVAIVKALKDIKEGEEICNCYGIDYRDLDKNSRREACENEYYFSCKCEICCDPSKEIDLLDSFKCTVCSSEIFFGDGISTVKCETCGKFLSIFEYKKIFAKMAHLLKNVNTIKDGLKIAESTIAPNNSYLITCYDTLFFDFIQKSHLSDAYKYFIKSTTIAELHFGENSLKIGIDLLKTSSIFIEKFKQLQPTEIKNNLHLFKQIEEVHERSKKILQLYYPGDPLKSFFLDDELANIKMCLFTL